MVGVNTFEAVRSIGQLLADASRRRRDGVPLRGAHDVPQVRAFLAAIVDDACDADGVQLALDSARVNFVDVDVRQRIDAAVKSGLVASHAIAARVCAIITAAVAFALKPTERDYVLTCVDLALAALREPSAVTAFAFHYTREAPGFDLSDRAFAAPLLLRIDESDWCDGDLFASHVASAARNSGCSEFASVIHDSVIECIEALGGGGDAELRAFLLAPLSESVEAYDAAAEE